MQNAETNTPATTTLSSEAGADRMVLNASNTPASLATDGDEEKPAPEPEAKPDGEPAAEQAAEPAPPAAAEEAPKPEAAAETMSPLDEAIAAAADISPEKLDEYVENRDRLNDEANRHRAQRDEMNGNTKLWAQKRDGLNSRVREFVDKANKHRAKRDEYNGEVRKGKEVRDGLNTKAAEARTKLNELRAKKPSDEGPTIARLKKKLRALEYEQMTKVLTPQKERALVDEITATIKIIREKEKVLQGDEATKTAWEEFQKARDEAEAAHKRVTEMAELAQREHDAMVGLFEQADALRREADAAQEEFVKSKVEADRVHREYIEMVNQIRNLDKIVLGLRQKDRKVRREISQAEAKADADAIYEKFLKGEKLSTEDLMMLQKAGFL